MILAVCHELLSLALGSWTIIGKIIDPMGWQRGSAMFVWSLSLWAARNS